MFRGLQESSKALITTISELVWFMRGSLDYDYAFSLTPMEREIISDFIKKRMERMESGNKLAQVY